MLLRMLPFFVSKELTRIHQISLETMTVANCLTWCEEAHFAGLEYGRECWCGDELSSLSTELDGKACNMPCAGDKSLTPDFCGGSWAYVLFSQLDRIDVG